MKLNVSGAFIERCIKTLEHTLDGQEAKPFNAERQTSIKNKHIKSHEVNYFKQSANAYLRLPTYHMKLNV